jgi:hypothetical protein
MDQITSIQKTSKSAIFCFIGSLISVFLLAIAWIGLINFQGGILFFLAPFILLFDLIFSFIVIVLSVRNIKLIGGKGLTRKKYAIIALVISIILFTIVSCLLIYGYSEIKSRNWSNASQYAKI